LTISSGDEYEENAAGDDGALGHVGLNDVFELLRKGGSRCDPFCLRLNQRPDQLIGSGVHSGGEGRKMLKVLSFAPSAFVRSPTDL
jgi:hypothetical protein